MTHNLLTGWQARRVHASVSAAEPLIEMDCSAEVGAWGVECVMGAKAAKDKPKGEQPREVIVADSTLSELVIRNPAPTASPPSAPAGGYRIVKTTNR